MTFQSMNAFRRPALDWLRKDKIWMLYVLPSYVGGTSICINTLTTLEVLDLGSIRC